MADTTELVPELLEAGVHFGHQTKRWNPKMRPYIFEQKNQIYIINLDETVKQLQRATQFLQEVTRRGGKILFVGCKKQAQQAVKEAALACGQFYVNQRWLGGTLTNLATIRKSIGRLKFIEQIEQSPAFKKMGKQEIAALNREGAKLRRNLDGILEMAQLPDVLVVVDTTREQNAVHEARRITSRGGLARQRQFIGKLMRDVDPEPIRAFLASRNSVNARDAESFKRVEAWRERLILEGAPALEELERWRPGLDRVEWARRVEQLNRAFVQADDRLTRSIAAGV